MRLIHSVLTLAFPLGLFAQATISISSSGTTTPYDGLGGLTGGGVLRLLNDYPAQQKGEIQDFMFKPKYGMGLNILKMGIGGDGLDGEGAEPSHERVNGTIVCTRGYEWNFMQAAIARNPAVKKYGLIWSAPGWITFGGSTLFTNQGEQYLGDFANCFQTYSTILDYIGIWNENTNVPSNGAWIKTLYTYLGLNVTTPPIIVAADSPGTGTDWTMASQFQSGGTVTDSALKTAIGILGDHYITNPVNGTNTCSGTDYNNAVFSGKHLWETEGGPWTVTGDSSTWTAATYWIQELINNIRLCNASATIIWALGTGYYDTFPLPNAGPIVLKQPWSGNYTVGAALWAIAHFGQFFFPGDKILTAGCGAFPSSTGLYCTIMAANGTDYGVVAYSTASQTLTVNLSGTLSTGTVHPWCSSSTQQFIQNAQDTNCPVNQTPSGGTWAMTIPANYIITASTTTGQSKGSTTPPASAAFPYPYYDYFTEYSAGVIPKYFSPYTGAFEIAACSTVPAANCMKQQITSPLLSWQSGVPTKYPSDEPAAIIGNTTWGDQVFSTTAAILGTGSLKLMARMEGINTSSTSYYGQPFAYQFYINNSGAWKITIYDTFMTLSSGTATAPGNASHVYQMSVTGCSSGSGTATISVTMDGTVIATATDNNNSGNCYLPTGNIGLGTASTAQSGVSSGSYINAEFGDFWIGSMPVPLGSYFH